MATYTKERNIITFSLDSTPNTYKLDINTGVFYGAKGKPVQNCVYRAEIRHIFNSNYGRERNKKNIEDILWAMFDYGKTSMYSGFVEALMAADRLDAIGIPSLNLPYQYYPNVAKDLKTLRSYMDSLEEGQYFNYAEFRFWSDFVKVKEQLGSAGELFTLQMYSTLMRCDDNLTTEDISVCAYYLVRGKYWEYHQGNIRTLIDYIEMCRSMEKKAEKVNNFMREYVETKRAYELRKTEFDNNRIANNYARHSKAWEFKYGDYIIAIPTCGQDLITEGERMHHCVGSYVHSIIDNECYICFVRHKDNPDTPYITCQVYTDGKIGQYYLAYDRYITKNEDIEFKNEFQKYLNEIWNN